MILKIARFKNPVLRKKAKPVDKIDKKIKMLASDMMQTLENQADPEGVGLAAPQVGKSIRMFVVNYQKTKRTIINPKIIKKSKTSKAQTAEKAETKKLNKNTILEGCLSLPHYYGPLVRTKSITIKYTDLNNKPITETFKNFHAQIIEHEIDHLNGTLFIDHIIKNDSPLYKHSDGEWKEVELA